MWLLSLAAGADSWVLLRSSLPAPPHGPWSTGHAHHTITGTSILPPWVSQSCHHGYPNPDTMGIPIALPQAFVSHRHVHPTTAPMLPTSLLSVVSLEGSGSGYDNIPEVCKALKHIVRYMSSWGKQARHICYWERNYFLPWPTSNLLCLYCYLSTPSLLVWNSYLVPVRDHLLPSILSSCCRTWHIREKGKSFSKESILSLY